MQKIGQKFDTSKNLIYYYTKNNKHSTMDYKAENEKLKAEMADFKRNVMRQHLIEYAELQVENAKLKAMNEYLNEEIEETKGIDILVKSLIDEINRLKEELLQTKFDAWREVQQETNPQYTIDEEIGCLLRESDDTELIKKIFDELYAGQYEYVIETETYREWEDEDDDES